MKLWMGTIFLLIKLVYCVLNYIGLILRLSRSQPIKEQDLNVVFSSQNSWKICFSPSNIMKQIFGKENGMILFV